MAELPATHCYLLDADDDLADLFDLRMRLAARQVVTAPVFETAVGACDLGPWFELAGSGFGLLVLDGVMAVDACVGDRTATELLGAGDLLQPAPDLPDEILRARRRLAHAAASRASPCSTPRSRSVRGRGRMITRSCSGGPAAAPPTSTCCVRSPRSRASRYGWCWCSGTSPAAGAASSRAGSTSACRSRTACSGQIVGAERPSVSHALARLARSGLVTGDADDLHLHGSVESHLWQLMERAEPSSSPPPAHVLGARRLERSDAAT